MTFKKLSLSFGDVILINFDPIIGREQGGLRPAVVISEELYYDKTGLVIVCPMTSQIKTFPLHVNVHFNGRAGQVLSQHIRTLDFRKRYGKKIGRLEDHEILSVKSILKAITGL